VDAEFETLIAQLAGEGDLARRVETLVTALAHRIKATSNDQNVQRLSQDLRTAAPRLAAVVAGGR
jgi:hypothetical protein